MKAASPHLQRLIIAALALAARQGELLSLQWRDVDLKQRRVRLLAHKTKDGEGRVLPVSDALAAVLELVRARETFVVDGVALPPGCAQELGGLDGRVLIELCAHTPRLGARSSGSRRNLGRTVRGRRRATAAAPPPLDTCRFEVKAGNAAMYTSKRPDSLALNATHRPLVETWTSSSMYGVSTHPRPRVRSQPAGFRAH